MRTALMSGLDQREKLAELLRYECVEEVADRQVTVLEKGIVGKQQVIHARLYYGEDSYTTGWILPNQIRLGPVRVEEAIRPNKPATKE